jgi:hypothetical protein
MNLTTVSNGESVALLPGFRAGFGTYCAGGCDAEQRQADISHLGADFFATERTELRPSGTEPNTLTCACAGCAAGRRLLACRRQGVV